MPQNVTIENFKCESVPPVIFSWPGLSELALSCDRPVVPTKSVTVINQTQQIKLADNGNYLYQLKQQGLLTVTGSVL
jgi:hypothetical protein